MTVKKNNDTFVATQDNHSNHFAAIDLGSNSFHLIVAREQGGCLQIVHRQKQQVKLAAGLDSDNNLSQQAMHNAMSCLTEFTHAIASLPTSSVRIVATYALRKAKNSADFIAQAAKVIPYPIEVISGRMEAELIYNGVAHTQPIRGKTLIIDIGGGSTEFVIGNKFSAHLADSLEMGCISFQQRFFLANDITSSAMNHAELAASEQVKTIASKYRQCAWRFSMGTSGSIKVISQVMLELYGDDKISAKRLKRLNKQLIIWGHSDNIPLRSIENNRRPLLASATAILSACFNELNISHLRFSAGGVREGVLYELSDSRTDIDTRERTITNLGKLHHIDVQYNTKVLQQITTFNQRSSHSDSILNKSEIRLMTWAVQLHDIGLVINFKKRQHHGAYIIQHNDMPGFTLTEKSTIALLVKNHRGKIQLPSPSQESDYCLPLPRIILLIQILRIALLSVQVRLPDHTRKVSIGANEQSVVISVLQSNVSNKHLVDEITRQQKLGLAISIK